MSKKAENEALALRDLAVIVVTSRGEQRGTSYSYADARLRIDYCAGTPHVISIHKHSFSTVEVLNVIWRDGGDVVIVLHRGGSWQDALRRLAGSLDVDIVVPFHVAT